MEYSDTPLPVPHVISIVFGDWLVVNLQERRIEIKGQLPEDAATRRFLNACADQLGAPHPCPGPGLYD